MYSYLTFINTCMQKTLTELKEIIDLVETKKDILVLNPLPYKKTDLSPVMSKETLDYHYNALAKGYVDRYNKGEGDLEFNHAGAFLHNFHGHIASIYQISWSCDSKFILSASKDSTVKIWNVKSDKETKSCRHNLPGHADEVFCVDWSPNGENAASGSKDQRVNIWRH